MQRRQKKIDLDFFVIFFFSFDRKGGETGTIKHTLDKR